MSATVDAEETAASPVATAGDRLADRWPRGRSTHLAAWVFGAYVAVAGPLLVGKLGSFFWFFRDDWFFLTERSARSLDDLFRPHNGHWSTGPVLVFRGLWALFGVRTYVPYQATVVVAHLGVVVLLRVVMRRAGVGPWLATAAAGALVLFGPGREDIVWAFQIGYTGAIFLGLAQLLLADHDGPLGRRDGVALLAGAAALLFASTAIVMVFVVGLALLVRRGWKPAFAQTAPLAVLYGVWNLITHPAVSSPFGRPSARAVYEWVRSGQTAIFRALGHFTVVGWLLAVLLVAGVALALLTGPPASGPARSRLFPRLRRVAVPLAMLVGSLVFMLLTVQARWIVGPQGARASRFVYVGSVLTLPALAVAAQAIAARWRPALPVVALAFLVAVPANIASFDDPPFAAPYHRQVRDMVTYALAMPMASQVSASVHPVPDPYLSEGLDLGFLRQAAKSGKLDVPDGPVPALVANELKVRLSLSQWSPTAIPKRCRWVDQASNLRATRGTTYVWPTSAGVLLVRPLTPGRPPGPWVRVLPSGGNQLTGQGTGIQFDWQSAGGRAARLCRVG